MADTMGNEPSQFSTENDDLPTDPESITEDDKKKADQLKEEANGLFKSK